MFRHRIKDLMIVNAALAMALAVAITLKIYALLLIVAAMIIVLPLAMLESYLYGKKKGTLYRWRHPTPPRPRYEATIEPPPYHRRVLVPGSSQSFPAEPPPHPPARTRLFESSSPSVPVSRGSILLKVAGGLASSGSLVAATRIYQQVLDEFAGTSEARDAADRLRSISDRELRIGRPEAHH